MNNRTSNKIIIISGVCLLLCILSHTSYSQSNTVGGISIADDTIPPHPSAMLDVRSVSKGILIPRWPENPTTYSLAPPSPADGLIIYCTSTEDNGFWYYNAAAGHWKQLKSTKTYYPMGAIIMYYPEAGTDINTLFDNGVGTGELEGWVLCDSRNGTPDLRGRFIVGARNQEDVEEYEFYGPSEDNINPDANPADEFILEEKNMPRHNHKIRGNYYTGFSFNHTHKVEASSTYHDHEVLKTNSGGGAGHGTRLNKKAKNTGTKSTNLATTGIEIRGVIGHPQTFNFPDVEFETTGNNDPINNKPEYYKLVFIMRTKDISVEFNTINQSYPYFEEE